MPLAVKPVPAGALIPSVLVSIAVLVALACPPGQDARAQERGAARENIQSFSPLARLLTDAGMLVDSRQFRAAWRLLEPYTELYSGDTEFDFLLGVAALESSRPADAVLAFERVLQRDPQRWRARAELARAQAALQARKIAEREFAALASQQLPPATRALIGRYLDAVTRVPDQPDPLIETSAGVGLGWDDNAGIDSVYDSRVLSIATQLAPDATDRPASLRWRLEGGIRTTVPINGRLQWTTGLAGWLHGFPSERSLDQQRIDLSTGFVYRNQCHQLKMLGMAQVMSVDYDVFRNGVGLIGQWQCDLDATSQLGGFVHRFEFRFPDDATRDAARQALGISYARRFPAADDLLVLSTAHTGREYSQPGLASRSYHFAGVDLMLIKPVSDQLRGALSISYEHRRFDGDDIAAAGREDRQTEFTVGLQRDLADHWTIEPQLVLTRHRSSLPASAFSRTQAQLVARYRSP